MHACTSDKQPVLLCPLEENDGIVQRGLAVCMYTGCCCHILTLFCAVVSVSRVAMATSTQHSPVKVLRG